MPRCDFAAQRLYVEDDLRAGASIAPTPTAVNYLLNVLRLRAGAPLLLFNGRDGEWRARLAEVGRRDAKLVVEAQTRPQEARADLDYCFAPLKQARLDYMAQKATEMGAGRLVPVLTARTQLRRVNLARIAANVVEAAEQCGILAPPEVAPAVDLSDFLAAFPKERLLIFCDEDADAASPAAALQGIGAPQGVSLLIGPEGGFAPQERKEILTMPNILRLSLGPRILRADTAAVAALALTQTFLGDWGGQGHDPATMIASHSS